MRKLSGREIQCVSGARSNSSGNFPLAEDMIELIANSSAANLKTNKFIRVINGIFGTSIRYL